jgi:hypothetical protein
MNLQTCSFRRGGVALHPKVDATRNTPPTRYCCNGVAQHPCNTRQVADLAGIIRRNPRWLFRADHRRMIVAMIARITAETLQKVLPALERDQTLDSEATENHLDRAGHQD